ncbi:MAG: SDR family NAD(P)-dependent oxidoreductase [Labilithrix sp.]|nr:SDR family NAD(P)-dependent oxidoreductase [Labilithrix sp.]
MEERSFADDKLVLVTGATDGIGKETARALLRSGARVLLMGGPQRRRLVWRTSFDATRREARPRC